MHATGKTYLPAAGRDWLLPFYDPFTKVLGVEASSSSIKQVSAPATESSKSVAALGNWRSW